jgi:excinuclease UvrABC nuclease subunit
MEDQRIEIPPVRLHWSDWTPWEQVFCLVAEGGANIPNRPGVYEARREGEEPRLTIGKAANLRMRVQQGLVRGQAPHSAGKRIHAQEPVAGIVARWAETERPAAVEEHLHQEHKRRFGRLPEYVDHT